MKRSHENEKEGTLCKRKRRELNAGSNKNNIKEFENSCLDAVLNKDMEKAKIVFETYKQLGIKPSNVCYSHMVRLSELFFFFFLCEIICI